MTLHQGRSSWARLCLIVLGLVAGFVIAPAPAPAGAAADAVQRAVATTAVFASTTTAHGMPASSQSRELRVHGSVALHRELVSGFAAEASVTAGRGSVSLFNQSEDIAAFAKNVPSEDGYFDVAGHGDEVSMEGPNGEDISPSQLAGSLRANPLYSEGTPVRLLSCSVGACDTGFAAQLAQELGATVKAPTGLLEIYESGRLVVRGGTWATFG